MGILVQKDLGRPSVAYLCTRGKEILETFSTRWLIVQNVMLRWTHNMESAYFEKFCPLYNTNLAWHLFSGIPHIVAVGLWVQLYTLINVLGLILSLIQSSNRFFFQLYCWVLSKQKLLKHDRSFDAHLYHFSIWDAKCMFWMYNLW